jgi:hypothetical protein
VRGIGLARTHHEKANGPIVTFLAKVIGPAKVTDLERAIVPERANGRIEMLPARGTAPGHATKSGRPG